VTSLKVRSLRQFEVLQLVQLQEQSYNSAMHNSVLGIWYSVVFCIKGLTVSNTLLPPPSPYKLTYKNCVYGKFPLDVMKTGMFQ
jgi:hypothetical protein